MYKTPHITYVQNYFCTYLFLFIYGKYEQNPLTLEKSAFQGLEYVLFETFWKTEIHATEKALRHYAKEPHLKRYSVI
jgi:hypothetical protein